jgi:hypothetical protein
LERRALILLALAACPDRGPGGAPVAEPAPTPAHSVAAPDPREPPDGCMLGASVDTGVIPSDVVIQWTSVSEGRTRAWRVHADGRYDWTYGRPLPLKPDDYYTWYEAPRLDAAAVAGIRQTVASRLPALVSFEPEGSYLHVPGRQGLDAPGVGSAWYTGPCQPAAYRALVAELDRILDADGRPRTKIRQRGD